LKKVAPLTHVFARIAGEPAQGMRWFLESLEEAEARGQKAEARDQRQEV